MNNQQPIRYYIVGPTASGKGTVARELADPLNAELISLDSMKIYKHMDIGTAKPPESVRKNMPMHLLDVVEPHESFTVADYIHRAEDVEESIRNRNRMPMFFGGTAMYLQRLLEGLFDGPEADWTFRDQLKEEAEEAGSKYLHEKLQQVDPDRAEEIHPNDQRRIIRALEVYEKTGRPMSELIRESQEEAAQYDHRVACLKWPREILHERISERVQKMIDRGWMEEVQKLREMDPPPGQEAWQAAGYREIIAYLEDKRTLEETIEQIEAAHRQLARHQMTWYRNLEEHIHWVPLKADMSLEEIATQVQTVLENRQ